MEDILGVLTLNEVDPVSLLPITQPPLLVGEFQRQWPVEWGREKRPPAPTLTVPNLCEIAIITLQAKSPDPSNWFLLNLYVGNLLWDPRTKFISVTHITHFGEMDRLFEPDSKGRLPNIGIAQALMHHWACKRNRSLEVLNPELQIFCRPGSRQALIGLSKDSN